VAVEVSSDSEPPVLVKRVILIVEDSKPIAELIRQALNEEQSYEAIAVGNGALAMDTLSGVKADLLILDMMLPGLTGLQLFDRLQQGEATRGLPAIFVTADTQAVIELRRRGMSYVLAKPFDLDELLMTVDRALRSTDPH